MAGAISHRVGQSLTAATEYTRRLSDRSIKSLLEHPRTPILLEFIERLRRDDLFELLETLRIVRARGAEEFVVRLKLAGLLEEHQEIAGLRVIEADVFFVV